MSSTYMVQVLLNQSIKFAEEFIQETIVSKKNTREHC